MNQHNCLRYECYEEVRGDCNNMADGWPVCELQGRQMFLSPCIIVVIGNEIQGRTRHLSPMAFPPQEP